MNELSIETLNVDSVLLMAGPLTARRGRNYYNTGSVEIDYVDGDRAVVYVYDSDEEPLEVAIKAGATRTFPPMMSCDCAQSQRSPWALCKHMVAAVLELADYLSDNPPNEWKTVLSAPLQHPAPRETAAPPMVVVFSLAQEYHQVWTLSVYSIPEKHLPETDRWDTETVVRAIREHNLASQARPVRTRITDLSGILNNSPETVAAANSIISMAQYNGDYRRIASILPLLVGCPVYIGAGRQPLQKPVTVTTEKGRLEIELERTDEGIAVSSSVSLGDRRFPFDAERVKMLFTAPAWSIVDDVIFRFGEASEVMDSFMRHPRFVIPAEEVEEFYGSYLVPLAERLPVRGELISWQDHHADPEPRVYLREKHSEFRVDLRFGYGDEELGYDAKLPSVTVRRSAGSTTLLRVHRQPETEERLWKQLSSFGLKRGDNPGEFKLRAKVDPVDFLLHQVPRLNDAGYEVYGEEDLTLARANRNRPTLSLVVSSKLDWFDITGVVSFGEIEISLRELRRAVRKNERYIKLSDGSIGHLPKDWLDNYRHLFGLSDESGDGVRISKIQAAILDHAISEADQASVDEEFDRSLRRLREFSDITPKELPNGFVGELRRYQKAGYDWLHFLHDYGFGGCLADDMGIGKTVQALVLLQSLRENGHAGSPDLIVVPKSLLFNWAREAARFTPGLRVTVHANGDRTQDTSTFEDCDVVLTTYGVMLRDIEMLKRYRFHYAILDESQAVKNPLSLTARAARALQADHRLVLTGTPVENNTVELWSQFAFLNPGLLGNLEFFRKEFTSPIERRRDDRTAEILRKMVYPFILRRTKDQVAPELPPRTVRVLYGDMEPEQRKLYNHWRDYYRALLLGMIQGEGMNQTRMKILEGLLRLRQICIHPRLFQKGYKGTSTKMEMLMETLETLRAEGHKALVFSQFTRMLKMVREVLDREHIPYVYMDGQTRDRQTVVDMFQNSPEIPFFLVSLKAGGVGLNLTAADYVVHIDPWWNPAVENQAADRTHRIGQDKPVFVYKLIATDSVEEKMLQLQERKRELVDKLISSESGMLKSLTADDIEALFS